MSSDGVPLVCGPMGKKGYFECDGHRKSDREGPEWLPHASVGKQ